VEGGDTGLRRTAVVLRDAALRAAACNRTQEPSVNHARELKRKENPAMLRSFAVLSGLAVAALLVPSAVDAGVQSPLAASRSGQASVVEPAQFWDLGRCRAWRRECAERWGWRSERWHRCLARHGCERHRYGDRWD
jgi:hypothetical protein